MSRQAASSDGSAPQLEALERRVLLSSAPLATDAALASAPQSTVAGGEQINLVIDASRTSGVAPLAVFFDATSTTGLAGDDHVDAQFEWRFDSTHVDPGAARRTATGFVSAHVYEKPGTYLATLIAHDELGDTAVAQTTIQVQAEPPGGWRTFCVSLSGIDTSCAPNAIALASTDQARRFLGSGSRVLFKRGEQFDVQHWPITGVTGPALIGAYTDPNDPNTDAPVLQARSTNETGLVDVDGTHDLRITDIHIIGSDANSGILVDQSSSNVLISRVEVERIDGIAFGSGSSPGETDGFFLFESSAHDFSGSGVFGAARRLALVGNTITRLQAPNGGHGVRIASGRGTYINANTIVDNNVFTAVTIRGSGWGSTNSEVVVSDNVVDSVMTFRPQNEIFDERVSNVVIERNLMRAPPGMETIQDGIILNATGVTIRNNVFYNVRWAIKPFTHATTGLASRISIYNNTQYVDKDPSHSTGFIGGVAERTIISNNLVISNTTARWSQFAGPGYTSTSHNIAYFTAVPDLCVSAKGNRGAAACTDPRLASVDPSRPLFLRPGVESPAIDAGAWRADHLDHAQVHAPFGTSPDVGAFEYAPIVLNRPPIISPIRHNDIDVDPDRPGLQVYAGTPIDFVAVAADPDGDVIGWQWALLPTDSALVVFSVGSDSPTGVRPATFIVPFGQTAPFFVFLVVTDGVSVPAADLLFEIVTEATGSSTLAAAPLDETAPGAEVAESSSVTQESTGVRRSKAAPQESAIGAVPSGTATATASPDTAATAQTRAVPDARSHEPASPRRPAALRTRAAPGHEQFSAWRRWHVRRSPHADLTKDEPRQKFPQRLDCQPAAALRSLAGVGTTPRPVVFERHALAGRSRNAFLDGSESHLPRSVRS